jgi:uncharacterized protein YgbK (DUF1537 family)
MRDIAGAPEPVAAIAVVADDLTGAADTGAAFAGAGLSTLVTWTGGEVVKSSARAGRHVRSRVRLQPDLLRQAEAVAIDAGTRALDMADAAANTAEIVRAVRTAGVGAIYKKGDSLLRGHIAAETAAVLGSWQEGAVAIAAFAFPDAGRTTLHGRQCAAELERALPIVPLFERADVKTCAIDLEIVRGDDFDACMRDAAGRCAAIVLDAVSNADLARIVRAGQRLTAPVVWVGTGGLARALAASMRRGADRKDSIARVARRGPVMIVCGSASRVAREQIARVVAAGAMPVEVPAAMLQQAGTAAARTTAADAIHQALDGEQDVVVFPTLPEGAIEPAVAHALGDLVSLAAARVGGVALTGGDTATAVLRAWGTTGLRIVDEIEPGVPLSVSEGAHRMAVVTKAGAFGSPDVLVKSRERLHEIGAG